MPPRASTGDRDLAPRQRSSDAGRGQSQDRRSQRDGRRSDPVRSHGHLHLGRHNRMEAHWDTMHGAAKKAEKGYSGLQSLLEFAAVSTTLFYGLRRYTKVKDEVTATSDDCAHVRVVVAQLDELLDDDGVIHSLTSDQAGRRLYAQLKKSSREIHDTLDEMKPCLRRYGGSLSVTSRLRYIALDTKKLSGLREKLRHETDDLQELMIWLNRYDISLLHLALQQSAI